MRRFSRFAAIDWSGAVGAVQPSIAVAVTRGQRDVGLIAPGPGWSRAAVRDWLAGLADERADMLIGLDLSMGFPFLDAGGYFPGWDHSPPDAPALWSLVDRLSAEDPHLAASSFVGHPGAARHFRQRGATGTAFAGTMGRLRITEHGQAAMGLRPYSCFNLVGAAQVGKASLTGMRVLHALRGRVPVWPFDPLPESGPVMVEIYTSLAALAAGRRAGRSKMRDAGALSDALAAFGAHAEPPARLDDHASDALVTAAWLRQVAHRDGLWSPGAMTARVARTEGWTFGVP
jgi:hypothetical protein